MLTNCKFGSLWQEGKNKKFKRDAQKIMKTSQVNLLSTQRTIKFQYLIMEFVKSWMGRF